jgi:predicted HD phosphohydrolase
MQHVSFIRMDEGTAEDYALLNALEDEFVVALPDRLLAALASLKDSLAGYQINRLEHSLQSATRAEADGADIELIVGALIHDLGDDLAPLNHSQLAAAIIRPLCPRRSGMDYRTSWRFPDVLLWRCNGR